MRVFITLPMVCLVLFGQQVSQKPELASGPFVIPLILDQDEVSNVEPFLRVEYRVSPKGEVLAIEKAEKIWFFDDVPVLILGSTGNVLPNGVFSRALAWVRLFDGDRLVGEYPIHPRRDKVQIQNGQAGMIPALSRAMVGVDATYIAQVAHYLAGNVTALDVLGSTYGIDGYGTVIDASGNWLGQPTGYWKESAPGNYWTPRESLRAWTGAAMSADGSIQTAVADGGQIYASTDTGATWTPRESDRDWYGVAMSADGTIQTAVAYNGQIYVSLNTGITWKARGSNGTWVSAAMSNDGTIQTAVPDYGQIYVSTNSGTNWTPRESDRSWRSVAMSADGSIQTAVAYGGQIYVSTNSGTTWTPRESDRGWRSAAMSADGSIQTAVAFGGQVYVSMDTGTTWTPRESDRAWISVALSADGSIQTAAAFNGQIYVSTDTGATWTPRESVRDWHGVAMSNDGSIQTAVVNGGQIYVSLTSISVTQRTVGIGTTMPDETLDVHGNAIIDGDLTVTGACSGCASDRALKNNITPLMDALDKISQLEGVSFDWVPGTQNARYDPSRQIGVIAQDVAQVFPELVGIDSRGYQYVDYQKLVVPLIEAVKQLQSQNEDNQAQIEELRAMIEARRVN